MNQNEYPFFFLNFLANIAQLYDLQLNLEQVSNDELLQELQNHDKILVEQTNKYLKKILKNQEKIIKLLEDK